ncbi:site-specific DNA-methyltransferase [Candidatus Falkowbacteria bacterium]|nr:site-specific DNA-methyltransferase [Candidatus Falkowbacteria bacterium]
MLKINKIYHSDCFEFLKKIENKSIDLVVVDPPYFLNKDVWDTFNSHKEFLYFTFSWIDALIPKIKNNGSLYIFNTPFNCAFILSHILKHGLKFRNWITWDKRDGLSNGTKKYANGQETILFFTKSNDYVFNHNDIRVPYESTERIFYAKKKGILKNGKRWFPNPKGRLCGEVWHITSERHKNKINGKTPKLPHFTPKPLEMIERIIKASSNRGDLVLDCFMGTGTTALAAKKLGRNFIGCDSNKKYVLLANKRLKTGKF